MTGAELLSNSFRLVRDGMVFVNVIHREHVETYIAEAEAELKRTKRALWLARADRAKLLVQLDMEGHYDYIVSQESQGKTPKAELDRWYAGWDYAERICRTYAEKFREVE